MINYIFKTTTTMKEYNSKKWWINSDIVPEIKISAENLKEALSKYKELVYEKAYIEISDNALKTKNEMYVDTAEGTKQVDYVITGKTEFEDRDNYRWSTQYIDLWVNILTVVDTEFE